MNQSRQSRLGGLNAVNYYSMLSILPEVLTPAGDPIAQRMARNHTRVVLSSGDLDIHKGFGGVILWEEEARLVMATLRPQLEPEIHLFLLA